MQLIDIKLRRENLERISGETYNLHAKLPTIRKKHYRIIKGVSVGGDAPKELLRVYEYERGKMKIGNPRCWDIFIAKTGHKWYPNESITEYLLNCIGVELGLNMAESKLCIINNQVRFLSKLFRNEQNQILEHGAELYSGYLGDRDFVEEAEEQKMARDFFTITFTYDTLKHIYPHQVEDIFLEFTKMLVYDAVIGNNDRHFYNWAVIKHLNDRHQPKFSPIYDTARALFWNRSDEQIKRFHKDPAARNKMLYNYVIKSRPKTGLEKNSNANHFDIIKVLSSNKFSGTKDVVNELINPFNSKRIKELVNDEFSSLLCKERIEIILKCLSLRFELLEKAIRK